MVLGNERGYEISDMAIRAAIAARPDFCWKGSCCKPRLINCFWGEKKKTHTPMIWAKILLLSWCKPGADLLIFAWLPFVYDKALASTQRVILQAKMCAADTSADHLFFPQKSASVYCCTL